jgi:hypothetical protein
VGQRDGGGGSGDAQAEQRCGCQNAKSSVLNEMHGAYRAFAPFFVSVVAYTRLHKPSRLRRGPALCTLQESDRVHKNRYGNAADMQGGLQRLCSRFH